MEEVAATPTETPASPDPQPTASPAATPTESAPVEAAPASEATNEGGGEEAGPTSDELLVNLAEHVQEREKAKFKEGRSEAHSRMQPSIQRMETSIKAINQGIENFANDFTEWREDPTTNTKGLDRVMTKHRETFETLGQLQLERGGWQGWAGFVNNLATQSKNIELAQEFLPRLQHMVNGDSDDGFWPDLMEHLTDSARKEGFEDGRKKGNKETEERQKAEARANGRSEQAPPPKVAGSAGGGGKTDREKLLDPATSYDQLVEIRQRQRAG